MPDYSNSKSATASNEKKNEIKNRYTDIKAYDDSRVILKTDDNDQSSDYINANFVQGYSVDNKFIATQGPKKETTGDFWKMIDQYNIRIIVMLTDLVENNYIKCQKYWPNALKTTEVYEDYSVTFLDEKIFVDYIKRQFSLANNTNGDSKPKLVSQYFYPSWADKFAPNTDLISIFNLIREVNLENSMNGNQTIAVHCSAGNMSI